MTTLILLTALASAPPPSADATQPVHAFATLTDAEAQRLHGQRIQAWVMIDGPGTELSCHVSYQLKGEGDVSRTLMVFHGQEVSDKRLLCVEGTLLVIDHPTRVIRGVLFAGFREYPREGFEALG